jgi:hypothetical protein
MSAGHIEVIYNGYELFSLGARSELPGMRNLKAKWTLGE